MKKYFIKIIRFFYFLIPFEIRIKLIDYVLRSHSKHFYKLLFHIKHHNYQIQPSDVIIDAGAYDGNSCIFWNKFFPYNKVYGFEPNINMYYQAIKNVGKIKNIEILNFALGNKSETATLNITKNIASSSLLSPDVKDDKIFDLTEKQTVTVKRLDEFSDLITNNIFILKIDTQGSEYAILEGADLLLSKTVWILIEMSNHNIYKGSKNWADIDSFLRSKGFVMIDIIDGLFAFDFDTGNKYPKYQLLEFDVIYLNKKFL